MAVTLSKFKFNWRSLNTALNQIVDAVNRNAPLEGEGIHLDEKGQAGVSINAVANSQPGSQSPSAGTGGGGGGGGGGGSTDGSGGPTTSDLQNQITGLQNEINDLQSQINDLQNETDDLTGANNPVAPGGILTSGNNQIDIRGIPVPAGATGFVMQMRYLNPAAADGVIQVTFNPPSHQDNVVYPNAGTGQSGYFVAWYFGANGQQLGQQYASNQVQTAPSTPGQPTPINTYRF